MDDKKVSDHHAIIPTEEFVQLEHMSNEERKIYDLVVRRFISVLYPACEYEETSLTAQAAGEAFAARGKRILPPAGKPFMKTAQPGKTAIPTARMTRRFSREARIFRS